MKKNIRVFGVDPSSTVTGYSVVDEISGELKAVTWGVIKPLPVAPFPEKLKFIYNGISKLIFEYKPDVVAVEDVFFARNAKSALKLGHARGAILVAASNSSVEVAEYSALRVKQSVVGYGRADKEQVRAMTMQFLNLREKPHPLDASDALAVAICHINSIKILNFNALHSRQRTAYK